MGLNISDSFLNKIRKPSYLILFTASLLIGYNLLSFTVEKARENSIQQFNFQLKVKTNESLSKGYLLISPRIPKNLNVGKLVILDLFGEIIYQKNTNGVASDFRQWKCGKSIYYSYSVYDRYACQEFAALGSARHIVILDSAFNEIKQIHLVSNGNISIERKQDLDHHDFIMLSLDHYFTIASYPKIVNNLPLGLANTTQAKVAAPIIQEIKNGAVVWQWDASDYSEFYTSSMRSNEFSKTSKLQDYMHINSILLDLRDSNLIVSFHNLDQVIKIRRPTGEILWRLGGKNSDFQLTTDCRFSCQHNATLIDDNSTLLILDNGEKKNRAYSRVLEFKLNEKGKYIESFKSFNIPGALIENQGSVEKVGGDYFICGGDENYFIQCDATSGLKKMKMDFSHGSYRGYYVNEITGINFQRKGNY